MTTPDRIAMQMRDERRRLNLSLDQAAVRIQMPAVVLGSYERGDRQPSLPKLRAWVEGLAHKLVAIPTGGAAIGASLRIEYAVAYGPSGDGLIECADEAEAAAICSHLQGSRVVSRSVRVGRWGAPR
jgi:transcriptional regulator with XRE-family HTH domain